MRTREHTLGTRLTADEYDAALLAADQSGLPPAAWLRQVVRQVVLAPTSPTDPVLQTLLQQVEALRIILLNIILHLTTDGQAVTVKSLTTICAVADKHKVEQARKLLALVTQSTQEGVTPSCPSKT